MLALSTTPVHRDLGPFSICILFWPRPSGETLLVFVFVSGLR